MTRPDRRVTAALVAVALILLPASSASANTTPCPAVVSHATSALVAPENTVAGIYRVAGRNADGTLGPGPDGTVLPVLGNAVEMDVQWSSSGFPVLMHDATVDRTTNGTGSPSTLGLSQLTALLANDYAPWNTNPAFTGANAPHVPYGWDFMHASAISGLDVLLDIHATPTEIGMDKLEHYITAAGWADRTLIMGPPAAVTAMRGWHPELHFGVIEYNAATTIRRGSYVASLGAEAYVVPARDVDPAAVAYWHSYGLSVWAWSSDTPAWDVPATWLQLADAGVDRLITNQPAAALEAYAAVCTSS